MNLSEHKNSLIYLFHLLFWGITSWFILSTFAIIDQDIEMIDNQEIVRVSWDGSIIVLLSLILVLSVFLFYFNLWNISRLGKSAKRLEVLGYSFASFVVPVMLYLVIIRLPYFRLFPHLTLGIILSIFLFYFAIAFAYAISKVWLKTEASRQQLAVEKKQAELDLLRSQLQPHFLFNVLNNLLALVDQQKDSVLADSIDRLSGLLRHVVYDSAQDRIPIAKEIAFIQNFADLQLLRFEEKEVKFEIKVKGNEVHQVEPGIFLPFVENAFKYGTAPEEQSYIKIQFDLSLKDELIFEIQNKVLSGLNHNGAGGSGLIKTKERLQIVYPGKHDLSIQQDDAFLVNLKLLS